MDKYFRDFPRFKGGDSVWVTPGPAKTVLHNEFFGVDPSSSFWVKVAGVWKQATTFIKVSGSWKSAVPYFRDASNWF